MHYEPFHHFLAFGDILFFNNIIIVYKLKPVIYSNHFTAFADLPMVGCERFNLFASSIVVMPGSLLARNRQGFARLPPAGTFRTS
jgi:hypothetical protein